MSRIRKEKRILRKLAVIDNMLCQIFGDDHVKVYKICYDDVYWKGESICAGYQITIRTHDGVVHIMVYDTDELYKLSVDDILNDISDRIFGETNGQ